MKFLRTSHKSQGEGRYYTALDELTNEISILKQLNHKNIISLYDIIEDDEENETILVLEYVEIGTMMNYNEDANVFMYNEKLHRFHDSFQWNSDGFVIPNVIQIVNYIQQIAQVSVISCFFEPFFVDFFFLLFSFVFILFSSNFL